MPDNAPSNVTNIAGCPLSDVPSCACRGGAKWFAWVWEANALLGSWQEIASLWAARVATFLRSLNSGACAGRVLRFVVVATDQLILTHCDIRIDVFVDCVSVVDEAVFFVVEKVGTPADVHAGHLQLLDSRSHLRVSLH